MNNLNNNLNIFFNKNKKLILSIFIFLLVFCTLGIPFIKWGFSSADDFSLILHSRLNSFKNFGIFFKGISGWDLFQPCNSTGLVSTNYLNAYYRPLMFIFYYLTYILFGLKAYYFFLVSIFFHALNSIILFNLFLYFSGYLGAFLGALFFAYHSSLADWLGWPAAQPYQVCLFFILLSIIFLKKYLDKDNLCFYLLSGMFYFISLLGRELYAIYPILIIGFVYFYQKINNKKNNFLNFIKKISLYFLVLFFYLFIRFLIFPKITGSSGFNFYKLFSVFLLFKNSYYNWVCGLIDWLSLWWLPWGYFYLKILIFLIFVFIIFFLLIKSTQKLLLIFILISIMFSSWPVFLGYFSRYLYESIPVFILFFLLGIKYSKNNLILIKKILIFIISLTVLLNSFYLIINLKFRETNFNILNKAFDELVLSPEIKNKNLCFINIPYKFSPGVEKAIWLKNFNLKNLIFMDYDVVSCINTKKSLIKSLFEVKIKHYFDSTEKLDKDFIKIIKLNNGFRFISLDSNKFWFIKKFTEGYYDPVGSYIINNKNKDKIIDYTVILRDKYLKYNPVFITWDYNKQKFCILGEFGE